MAKSIGIGLIGTGFMGRAHANAWSAVNRFFELPRSAALDTVASKDASQAEDFAQRWGFAHHTGSWRSMLKNDDISIVDVGTPNHMHKDMSIEALQAGKHVACEKPLAGTLADARAMRDALRRVRHMQEAARARAASETRHHRRRFRRVLGKVPPGSRAA